MKVAVTVIGDTAVAASFMRASGSVGAEVAKATRQAAEAIADTQRELVRKRSMETHDSISVVTEGDGRFTQLTAEIGADTFYSRFLEFGTVKMQPFPFVGPSYDQHVPDWLSTLEDLAGDV